MGENKNFGNFERSFGKWVAKSQNTNTTVNVKTCIPMQRKSIYTVVSSSENLADDDHDVLTDNQWMAIVSTQDHRKQFKKNADTIKQNVIKRGAPKAM